MEQHDIVVDLSFPVRGITIPVDHGYPLYAAISRRVPTIHGDKTVGIHPIRGQLIGQRKLALTPKSHLVLRLPVTRIPEAICLAGQRLDVDGAQLRVGVPTVLPLRPAAMLMSRLVVIRGFTEADAFLAAVQRQLTERAIEGIASLVPRRTEKPMQAQKGSRDPFVRRTLQIKEREIVGFALQVGDLKAQGSLTLQALGLGGRRRLGCGIFLPMAAAKRAS